tara:strand:- start:603 stop:1091 length:489 start_codon:yes stop_codon:yes gene_type:complete
MPRKSRTRRKSMPWSGWAKISPKGRARTVMKRKCGKKCFLGPKKSFPVCAKGTCKVNSKGLYAAYVRARQWGKKRSSYKGRSRPTMKQSTYKRVARKAKSMLKRRGALRGGKKRKSRSRKRKRSRSRRRKSRSRKRKRSRSRRRKRKSRSRKRKRSRRRRRR